MIARGIASSQNLLLFLSHQLLCGWPSILKKNTNTTRHNWFPCGWNKKNVHPKQIAMRQKLKRIFSCKLKPPNPVCKNVSDLVSTCTCRAMCTKRRIFFSQSSTLWQEQLPPKWQYDNIASKLWKMKEMHTMFWNHVVMALLKPN
jgi:hypothetical protein